MIEIIFNVFFCFYAEIAIQKAGKKPISLLNIRKGY